MYLLLFCVPDGLYVFNFYCVGVWNQNKKKEAKKCMFGVQSEYMTNQASIYINQGPSDKILEPLIAKWLIYQWNSINFNLVLGGEFTQIVPSSHVISCFRSIVNTQMWYFLTPNFILQSLKWGELIKGTKFTQNRLYIYHIRSTKVQYRGTTFTKSKRGKSSTWNVFFLSRLLLWIIY